MIKRILTSYAARLDEYLRREFARPEGVAEVGFLGSRTGEPPCKLIVSLINIEREAAGGYASGMRRDSGEYIRSYPPLLLNLDLMLSAVYDDQRYAESLAVLSSTLHFIQSAPTFEFEKKVYSVEMAGLSLQDVHNIWTTLGGQYYPSVMCKLRRLAIDAAESSGSGRIVTDPPRVHSGIRKEEA